MEKYSFFNDVNNDRVYYAEDFARHLSKYFTNGIFNNSCLVLANNENMTVNVNEGSANINGYRYDNDSVKVLTVENADGVLNRIDNVVIRLDLTNRTITTQIVKGEFAENPVAPDIIRTTTIYDLRIAKINIPAGITTITQDLVTDTRFITSDCGNVISTVETPDTEDLFLQLQASAALVITAMQKDEAKLKIDATNLINNMNIEFDKFIETNTSNFNNEMTEFDSIFSTWFNSVKNIINSETAMQLNNEINNIKEQYATKEYVDTQIGIVNNTLEDVLGV